MSESAVPSLKRLRTERNLSQPQLAEALGVNRRTIIRWEQGDGEPSARELLQLAMFFHVSIDQLVSDLVELAPPIKVAALSGKDLDYWVARACGLEAHMTEEGAVFYEPGVGQRPVPAYSTDWAHGGPLIDEADIQWQPISSGRRFDGMLLPEGGWLARCSDEPIAMLGRTKLISAMRAYVSRKFGAHIIT